MERGESEILHFPFGPPQGGEDDVRRSRRGTAGRGFSLSVQVPGENDLERLEVIDSTIHEDEVGASLGIARDLPCQVRFGRDPFGRVPRLGLEIGSVPGCTGRDFDLRKNTWECPGKLTEEKWSMGSRYGGLEIDDRS